MYIHIYIFILKNQINALGFGGEGRLMNGLVACGSKETLRTNNFSAIIPLHNAQDHRGLHVKSICPLKKQSQIPTEGLFPLISLSSSKQLRTMYRALPIQQTEKAQNHSFFDSPLQFTTTHQQQSHPFSDSTLVNLQLKKKIYIYIYINTCRYVCIHIHVHTHNTILSIYTHTCISTITYSMLLFLESHQKPFFLSTGVRH